MSRPGMSPVIIQSEAVDIGNTGANVAFLLVPSRCVLDQVQVVSNTVQTSNAVIGFDVLSNGTFTANAAGIVTVPATSVLGQCYMDSSARGLVLKAGDVVFLNVLDAGDSGEKFKASVLAIYEPESDANEAVTDLET